MMPRARCASMLLAVLLCVGVPILPLAVKAQDLASPAPGKGAAFQSSGLSASINSAVVVQKQKAAVQIALQNVAKNRIYLVAFGSNKASTDIGIAGTAPPYASGINSCFFYNGQDDSYSYNECMTGSQGIGRDINKYSYIEPGDTVVVSMEYNFPGDASSAKTISFSLKLIARPTTGDVDSLSDAEAEKAIGRPRPVNINFPLISLKN